MAVRQWLSYVTTVRRNLSVGLCCDLLHERRYVTTFRRKLGGASVDAGAVRDYNAAPLGKLPRLGFMDCSLTVFE